MFYRSAQKKNSGFGLIEIIVALSILVTAFASLYGAVQLSNRALRKAADRTEAAYLLEEASELMRHLRDTSWSEKMPPASNDPYCLDVGWHKSALHNQSGNMLLLHMNENPVTTGTILADASGNNNNGAYQAGASDTANKSNTTATTSAQFGSSITFDGVDDYISVPLAADPQTAYTIEAWVKPAVVSNQSIIVRTNCPTPSGCTAQSHQLRISGTVFQHYTYDPPFGLRTVSGTTNVVAGQWYHVVGVAQTGGSGTDYVRLYVNGVDEGTHTFANGLWQPGDNYFIGSRSGVWFGYFNGQIDGVAIYHRRLSDAEIQDHYSAGPPCQRHDGRFSRTLLVGDVCRDASNDIVGNVFAGTCSLGTADPDTKFVQTTINWDTFSEAASFYIADLLSN